MKKMDDIVIEKMVDETFQMIGDSNCDDSSNLISYFENKIIASQTPSFYRVKLNGKILDFPKNWSIFENLNNGTEILLNKANNPDFIFDIFKMVDRSIDSVLISKSNGIPSFSYSRITIEEEIKIAA